MAATNAHQEKTNPPFNTKIMHLSRTTSPSHDTAWTHETLKELEKIVVSPHFKPVTFQDRMAARLADFINRLVCCVFSRHLYRQAAVMETLGVVPGWVAVAYYSVRSLVLWKKSEWQAASVQLALLEQWHLYSLCAQLSTSGFSGMLVWVLSFCMTSVWFMLYTPLLLLFPQAAHRFNGYLKELGVDQCSCIIGAIDSGLLENPPSPRLAIKHWKLPADATIRDVMLLIRAEQADFREIQHEICTHYRDCPDKLELNMSSESTPASLHLPDRAASRVRPSVRAFAGLDERPSDEADLSAQTKIESVQFFDDVASLDENMLGLAAFSAAQAKRRRISTQSFPPLIAERPVQLHHALPGLTAEHKATVRETHPGDTRAQQANDEMYIPGHQSAQRERRTEIHPALQNDRVGSAQGMQTTEVTRSGPLNGQINGAGCDTNTIHARTTFERAKRNSSAAISGQMRAAGHNVKYGSQGTRTISGAARSYK